MDKSAAAGLIGSLGAAGLGLAGLGYMANQSQKRQASLNYDNPGRGQENLLPTYGDWDRSYTDQEKQDLILRGVNPYTDPRYNIVGGQSTVPFYAPPGTTAYGITPGTSTNKGLITGSLLSGLGLFLASRGKIKMSPRALPWAATAAVGAPIAGHLYDRSKATAPTKRLLTGWEAWKAKRDAGMPIVLAGNAPLYASEGMRPSEKFPLKAIGRNRFYQNLVGGDSKTKELYDSNPQSLRDAANYLGGYMPKDQYGPAIYRDPNKTLARIREAISPQNAAAARAAYARESQAQRDKMTPFNPN